MRKISDMFLIPSHVTFPKFRSDSLYSEMSLMEFGTSLLNIEMRLLRLESFVDETDDTSSISLRGLGIIKPKWDVKTNV